MHCEVIGSVDSIHWFRNGQLISADNTTVFNMGNKTIILNPVQHSDNGDYECQAFNYVSNRTSSPYTVEVYCKYFHLFTSLSSLLTLVKSGTVAEILKNVTFFLDSLMLKDGPMNPVITGPSVALTGTHEILNCSSASHPPSHIRWYFNDSLVATTSMLMIGPLTLNMSGKYICMAFNNITGKNSTAYMMLTVLGNLLYKNSYIDILGDI